MSSKRVIKGEWIRDKEKNSNAHWRDYDNQNHTACGKSLIDMAKSLDPNEEWWSPIRFQMNPVYTNKKFCVHCLRHVIKNELDPWILTTAKRNIDDNAMIDGWDSSDKGFCAKRWHCPVCKTTTLVYSWPGAVSRWDVCSDECWSILLLRNVNIDDPVARLESLLKLSLR